MATQKNSNAADAATGTATLIGFRYAKSFCIASLDNGVQGIIGSTADMPLATMLQLKGQRINYKFLGHMGEYDRYQLEFAL